MGNNYILALAIASHLGCIKINIFASNKNKLSFKEDKND
jgi:hypothetical protein